MKSQETPERVTLARIVRVRGRKGEVAAEILTDFPERLTRLRKVWLVGNARGSPGKEQDSPAQVRACWLSPSRGGQAIFHFVGCDSIDQAQELVGLEVQLPFQERTPLPEGRYYISDLVGCEVWERPQAKGASAGKLGAVRDVQLAGGGTPLLVVDDASNELLIPLAEEICVCVDPAARRIEVVLPEGLRELNH